MPKIGRISVKLFASIALAALTLYAGCTFDSSLQGVRCNQDGERSDGRVCQDGHWITEADTDLDAQPPQDVSDAAPDDATDTPGDVDPDTDAGECAPNQTLCGGTCVDTLTSEDHCGACGEACNTYGSHSIALCTQGSCERTCEAGWHDVNGDWVGTDDPAASDGCEVACEPSEEVCDGVDNDCDGDVDEEVTTTYYLDEDDDGFGVTADTLEACAPDGNYRATEGGDCADDAFLINPDATESCNGLDDDCDSDTDEGCPCTGTETADCYTGDPGTAGQGLCVQGTKTCDGAGDWGSCQNEVTPQTEVCGDGDDNDCDGDTDCADSDCDAQSCGGGDEICFGGSCCTPQSDQDFCDGQGAQCGRVSGTDNCGIQRTDINCGGCGGGASCSNNICEEDNCDNGDDDDRDNLFDCDDPDCGGLKCGGGGAVCFQQTCCTPDDALFCSDQSAECGLTSGVDNCGIQRTDYDCGNCGGGTTCSSNACVEDNCTDGNDNDGDGDIDCFDSDCPTSPTTYYFDGDGDGFGVTNDSTQACSPDGNYTATEGGDCDDTSDKTFPGAAPNDSTTECMRDEDQDDWGDVNAPPRGSAGSDCDDADIDRHPGMTEQCEDDIDSDCDGLTDDSDPDAATWCSDNQSPSAGCGVDGNTTCCLNPGGSACK